MSARTDVSALLPELGAAIKCSLYQVANSGKQAAVICWDSPPQHN
jgi:hypothetical protein